MPRMMKLARDGLFSFSRTPLRLAMRMGMFSVVVAIGVALWAILEKLLRVQETIPGWASTVAIIAFLGGIQLLSIGILGEYIGSIFDESKRRPVYVVEELVNVKKDRQR
jgi:Na+/H+ antiporter NhaC